MPLEWVEDKGRKESSGQPLMNLKSARAQAGLAEERPGPCCAHPGGVGVPQHRPCPRAGHSPPGQADIQALEFLFISILLSFSHFFFLFYLHCHLLALISSLACGKLPKLDYRKVRKGQGPAAGSAGPGAVTSRGRDGGKPQQCWDVVYPLEQVLCHPPGKTPSG